MLELLDPRKVAARKTARLIAEKYLQTSPPTEGKSREDLTARMTSPATSDYDSLEKLLDKELRMYGLTLGQKS